MFALRCRLTVIQDIVPWKEVLVEGIETLDPSALQQALECAAVAKGYGGLVCIVAGGWTTIRSSRGERSFADGQEGRRQGEPTERLRIVGRMLVGKWQRTENATMQETSQRKKDE